MTDSGTFIVNQTRKHHFLKTFGREDLIKNTCRVRTGSEKAGKPLKIQFCKTWKMSVSSGNSKCNYFLLFSDFWVTNKKL